MRSFAGRDILSLKDFEREEFYRVFQVAKDLEPMIGRRNRVYEILNRKRGLTLAMIQKLHVGLGIPAESLLRQSAAPVEAG